jgi:hypothetical protein
VDCLESWEVLASSANALAEARPLFPTRKAGINMDPVYSVVKARSTRYCVGILGQAQYVGYGV